MSPTRSPHRRPPRLLAVALVGLATGGCPSSGRTDHPAASASDPAKDPAAPEAATESERARDPKETHATREGEAPPTTTADVPAAPEPKSIRLLIKGDYARRIAAFLSRPVGKNAGCMTAGPPTCGQVIASGGTGQSLAAELEAPELQLEAQTVLLSKERNEGKPMMRVRVQGDAATAIAEFLDPQLAHTPGGVITGENHSCVVASDGAVTCGFILAKNGAAYHLEHFGYH